MGGNGGEWLGLEGSGLAWWGAAGIGGEWLGLEGSGWDLWELDY